MIIFIILIKYKKWGENMDFKNLVKVDEEIYSLVEKELEREQDAIELIASENFASEAVQTNMQKGIQVNVIMAVVK